MSKRKTMSVDSFKEYANKMLKRTDLQDFDKDTLCQVLEHVLHESNQYQGFSYLYWLEEGCDLWHKNGEPEGREKDVYIYGPTNSKYRGDKYARKYY